MHNIYIQNKGVALYLLIDDKNIQISRSGKQKKECGMQQHCALFLANSNFSTSPGLDRIFYKWV